MIIPWQQLNQQTLYALLAEIVTRDGTDYGNEEIHTETKVSQLLQRLQSNDAELVWDNHTETGNIISRYDLNHHLNTPEMQKQLEKTNEFE